MRICNPQTLSGEVETSGDLAEVATDDLKDVIDSCFADSPEMEQHSSERPQKLPVWMNDFECPYSIYIYVLNVQVFFFCISIFFLYLQNIKKMANTKKTERKNSPLKCQVCKKERFWKEKEWQEHVIKSAKSRITQKSIECTLRGYDCEKPCEMKRHCKRAHGTDDYLGAERKHEDTSPDDLDSMDPEPLSEFTGDGTDSAILIQTKIRSKNTRKRMKDDLGMKKTRLDMVLFTEREQVRYLCRCTPPNALSYQTNYSS
jgi:hypothetical protein